MIFGVITFISFLNTFAHLENIFYLNYRPKRIIVIKIFFFFLYIMYKSHFNGFIHEYNRMCNEKKYKREDERQQ
jgi:hypothetical protein